MSLYRLSKKAVFVAVILTTFCSASNYYVSPSGLDSHSGLASSCADTGNAWKTIGHAAATYAAGDTLNVCDGTYAEGFTLSTNGTAGAPVVFQSVNKWGAKVTPRDVSGTNLVNIGGNYVTFKNFDVTGTPNSNTTIKCNGATHCSIVGNRIHDSGVQSSVCNSGAAVQLSSDNDAVIGNEIYNVGVPRTAGFRCNQFHGIYYGNGINSVIQNNVIFEVWQGYGIHINASGNVTGATVSDNTVFNSGDNTGGGTGSPSGGAEVLDCHATCSGNTFTNNIFANNQGPSACFREVLESSATMSSNTYSNNNLFNCGSNTMVAGSIGNTVTGNPTFVNYTGDQNGDYHLQARSPDIGAGTSVGAPSIDFAGSARPQGNRYDIGAVEFVATTAPDPPSNLTDTVD